MINLEVLRFVSGVLCITAGVCSMTPFPYHGLPLIGFGGFLIWKSIDYQEPPLGV